MDASDRNPVAGPKSGRHCGRKINNTTFLLKEHCLTVKDTLEFPDADIDEDGILVLNLRTARISNRALNHPRRRVRPADNFAN